MSPTWDLPSWDDEGRGTLTAPLRGAPCDQTWRHQGPGVGNIDDSDNTDSELLLFGGRELSSFIRGPAT